MNNEAVFDSARLVHITLLSGDGPKDVTLRFPTDEEWSDRQRRRKIIIKQLGRGVSETMLPDSSDLDLEVVSKLLEPDSAPIDGFEATRILDQLSQCEIDEVQPEGLTINVLMRVPGGLTSHRLRIPSARDIMEFRRSFARVLDLPYGRQELTLNLPAAGLIYSKLAQSSVGYASASVPIIHQAAAVRALIERLEAGISSNGDAGPNG